MEGPTPRRGSRTERGRRTVMGGLTVAGWWQCDGSSVMGVSPITQCGGGQGERGRGKVREGEGAGPHGIHGCVDHR